MGESPRGDNPRIDELRRRVQADPASIAFAALAEEYRRVGRFEEAIETCTAGLKRHPSYLSARVTLGRALIEVGRFDEAAQELELVLRAAPENLAAIRGMAEIHHRRGDTMSTTETSALASIPAAGQHAAPPPPADPAPMSFEPPAQAFEPLPAYEPPPPAFELPPAFEATPFVPEEPAAAPEPPAAAPIQFKPQAAPEPVPDADVFELPSDLFAPAGAPPDRRLAEVAALERFLAAVTAARAALRTR